MILKLTIGLIASASFIIGYFLRKFTKDEVDNFFKDYPVFKKCKKYLRIRAILYGITLGLSMIYFPLFSLALFSLGVVEGSVFTKKRLRKNIQLALIMFVSFSIILFSCSYIL